MIRWIIGLLVALLLTAAAHADPPADRIAALRRGVNLTNWFRFPASADPAALRFYLSDAAMRDLRRAGFTFVRLAVQPEFLGGDSARLALLLEAIARLNRQGLAVVIAPFPATWQLETAVADRRRLVEFWRGLALALRQTAPAELFPEVLNEPVFPHDPAGWEALQLQVLAIIRGALPQHTIVLTGNDWGSVTGLLALHPVSDRNVVYSFHFYDPPELTSLAAYRPGLDRAALARLPFPVADAAACRAVVAGLAADPATGDLMNYYCALRWNSARITDAVAGAAEWARGNHATLLLGEFGASQSVNPAARLAWLATVRGASEQLGIGWALWGYDDPMGFGVARPPGLHPTLDPATLTALGLLTPK